MPAKINSGLEKRTKKESSTAVSAKYFSTAFKNVKLCDKRLSTSHKNIPSLFMKKKKRLNLEDQLF